MVGISRRPVWREDESFEEPFDEEESAGESEAIFLRAASRREDCSS